MIFLQKAVSNQIRPKHTAHSSLRESTRWRSVFLQLIVGLAVISPGIAQIAPTQRGAGTVDGLEQFIAAQMQNWKVPGPPAPSISAS